MKSIEILKIVIDESLSGDEHKVLDLFRDDEVFTVLEKSDGDWYHFSSSSSDGEYFIRTLNGFETYFQERGCISEVMRFDDLSSAAMYFFSTQLKWCSHLEETESYSKNYFSIKEKILTHLNNAEVCFESEDFYPVVFKIRKLSEQIKNETSISLSHKKSLYSILRGMMEENIYYDSKSKVDLDNAFELIKKAVNECV